MQQGVHAAQAVQLAELLLQDALEISSAKGAHRIRRLRGGFDAGHEPITLREGELLASSLSRTVTQTVHARVVVSTHPFLHRSPRSAQRLRNLLRRPTLLGQQDGLHPNPHPRLALGSGQPSQLVQSMTILYSHAASPFQRTTTQDAQIQAWRNSARLISGRRITNYEADGANAASSAPMGIRSA
jgi:hypothetical protein